MFLSPWRGWYFEELVVCACACLPFFGLTPKNSAILRSRGSLSLCSSSSRISLILNRSRSCTNGWDITITPRTSSLFRKQCIRPA